MNQLLQNSIYKPHILIIDDDVRIRSLLQKFLIDSNFLATVAKDGLEAFEMIENCKFDMIILDVMMPKLNGFEFLTKLRIKSDVPVLMLTAKDGVDDRIRGLEIGADDYLAKPFEPRELLLRIEKILSRLLSNDQAMVVKFGYNMFYPTTGKLYRNNQSIAITTSEANLLKILCSNINNTISREDISEACGGVNERTIDVQIIRLRSKIENDAKNPIYLRTIRGHGYGLYQ
jgi:two-component system, OmpR family, phosphate regulon response regulator OmpR